VKPAFPELVFTPVRALVFAGDNAREREARLTLGETAVIVSPTSGSAPEMKALPYESVIAIYQSRSREPQWVTEAGAVNPVMRVDRGAFGFLKGDRDWLTIRTKDEFLPLRSDGNILKRVAAALEERTGLTVVRAERSRR
jgi:hypothetical protein